MLPISKLPEPLGLRAYKIDLRDHATRTAGYDNFKNYTGYSIVFERINRNAFYELRRQLLYEQRFVCAYCGQIIAQIINENGVAQMKTEHFNPQDETVANDLNYQNLLACCLGGQGNKGEGHCDSTKGEKVLHFIINPSILTQRDRTIMYKLNKVKEEVLILSSDNEKQEELNHKDILNLNHQRLRSRRFHTWKNQVLRQLGEERNWTVARVVEVRNSYNQITDGKHKEFKDFILWYLDDWLRKGER